jgi:thiamine-monophosphate kinase
LAPALRAHASAAMDLSDGLLKDLGRMCGASGVGARVMQADLPLSSALRRAIEAEPSRINTAIAAGDDYEILATVARESCTAFEAAAVAAGVAVTRIGEITSTNEVHVLDADGAPLSPGQSGWDHFRAP